MGVVSPKPYTIRDERIAAGRRTVLDIFSHLLSLNDSVVLSPKLAADLRAALAASGAYMGAERGRPRLSTEPHAPGAPITRGVTLPEQLYVDLLNALNMPNIVSEPYGPCATCAHSKEGRDRGWDSPCGGCGMGHPCYEAKDQLTIGQSTGPRHDV